MAVPWLRNYANNSAQGNKESATGTEEYILAGDVDPQAIITSPESFVSTTGIPLPSYGTAHPVNPNIFLDAYSVQRDGLIITAVAQYSNDSRFASIPIDVDQTDVIIGRRSLFTDARPSIPYAVRVPLVTPIVGPPQQPGSIATGAANGWRLAKRDLPESRLVRAFDVLITEQYVEAAELAIESQQGKLHKIRGVWQRYKGTGVAPTGEKRAGRKLYQLTHEWTIDRGTPVPPGLHDGMNTLTDGTVIYIATWNLVPALSNLAGFWFRPPFHSVVMSERDTMTADPFVDAICNSDIGMRAINGQPGDGWKDLPGTAP